MILLPQDLNVVGSNQSGSSGYSESLVDNIEICDLVRNDLEPPHLVPSCRINLDHLRIHLGRLTEFSPLMKLTPTTSMSITGVIFIGYFCDFSKLENHNLLLLFLDNPQFNTASATKIKRRQFTQNFETPQQKLILM